MSNFPASVATPDDSGDDLEILEWDRIRSFLKAPSVPLAIMEIESSAHADDVLVALGTIAGPEHVHVFRARGDEDFRRPLDWLEEQEDDQGVFVITDVQEYTREEDVARDFWTWANAQRERWPREHGHVVFLLQPAQVDDLCRYAPMLWDWIPLKFNLIRRESAENRVPASGTPYAAAIHQMASGQEPDGVFETAEGLRAARFEALREQLLRARQKGLPELLVRRNYAYPLFRELIRADRLPEARRVLETELGYQFPTELPLGQAVDAWMELRRSRIDAGHEEQADRALIFYFLPRIGEFSRGIGASFSYSILALIAFSCEEDDAAESWVCRMLESGEKLGSDFIVASAQELMGRILARRHDHASARQWYRRALGTYEKLGDGENSARVLGRLASMELAHKAAQDSDQCSALRNGRNVDSRKPSSRVVSMVKAGLKNVGRVVEKRARKRWLGQPAAKASTSS
jgi:hypothetical protein